MNVVIMGSGRTGSRLASELSRDGHAVTVIDWDNGAFSRLPEDFAGNLVVGNGVDQETLRLANIEDADVFVAGTSGDNRNIMASQVARHVYGVPRVITRIKDPVRAELFHNMGLVVDCRTVEGTHIILEEIEKMGETGLQESF